MIKFHNLNSSSVCCNQTHLCDEPTSDLCSICWQVLRNSKRCRRFVSLCFTLFLHHKPALAKNTSKEKMGDKYKRARCSFMIAIQQFQEIEEKLDRMS